MTHAHDPMCPDAPLVSSASTKVVMGIDDFRHQLGQTLMELDAYRKEMITIGERTGLELQIKAMKMTLESIIMKSRCGYAIQAAESALLNIQGEKTEGG
jgi:hypothetical protein